MASAEVGIISTIENLLQGQVGSARAKALLETLEIDRRLLSSSDTASRAELAMALNILLFDDLLKRVPTAARIVAEDVAFGRKIVFDHGALRTIDGPLGAFPRGHAAFGRLLEPLGYRVDALYPLPKLNMTGRAYVHRDLPEAVPQFFVSELHLDRLDQDARDAALRVFGQTQDVLDSAATEALARLEQEGGLPSAEAGALLKTLLAAFDRHHPEPALPDYETLLLHSKEAAWIATEGHAFNHATTRVPDVEALAQQLKARGYPLKEAVEVSANGRVRQTAILADKVSRGFRDAGGKRIEREVPGSFYEFISRDIDPATGSLDLTFDSGNATGIFAVTRSA
ncbi:2-oxoadipate dioxygenase/decarboxylase family protein [Novosphingobium sp. 9U]|uniref:2-oxoadipate dioxygenase/decarboxylase family protein n=1 Tax=Novosphingobium sp. 9U TaxID=2653158 RepID=UPI0012F16AB1|nr:DUF1338 family protein [Novosphingobium sp. 9U]VWX46884.1 conserved hypothetical protein [Novosphingobium sp. 9U]